MARRPHSDLHVNEWVMHTSASTTSASQPPAVELHFIIGQDTGGRWLALETHRLGGGLFTSLRNAIRFVELETGHRAGAYEVATAPVSLTF